MKKTLAIIGMVLLAATVGVVVTYSKSNAREEAVDPAYIFEYKQVTPDDQIVEGSQTALNTINNYLGKDVTAAEDFSIESNMQAKPIFGDSESKSNYYFCYNASCPDNYKVLYLYKDDTEIVEAGNNTKSCVFLNDDEEKRVDKDTIANNSVYAWYDAEAKETNCVLNKDAGYLCTSVWCYDETTNEVVLIWNEIECPIWANYYS